MFGYWLLIGDGWSYLPKILKGSQHKFDCFSPFLKHIFGTTFPKLEIFLHIEKLNINLACCSPGKPSLVTLLPERGSPKWNQKTQNQWFLEMFFFS